MNNPNPITQYKDICHIRNYRNYRTDKSVSNHSSNINSPSIFAALVAAACLGLMICIIQYNTI